MNDNMSTAQKKQVDEMMAKLPPEIRRQMESVDISKMLHEACIAVDQAMVDNFKKHLPTAHLALQLSLRSVALTTIIVADLDIHTPTWNKNLEIAREKMNLLRGGVLNLLSTCGWC